MDPGTGRDDRPGLLKLADLFPGHAPGEIREQLAAGVCSHVIITSVRPRARSSGPTRAAPVTGLLMRVLLRTASHARPGARLSGQQPGRTLPDGAPPECQSRPGTPYDAAPRPSMVRSHPVQACQGVPDTAGVGAEEAGAGDVAGGWLLAEEVVGVGVPFDRG